MSLTLDGLMSLLVLVELTLHDRLQLFVRILHFVSTMDNFGIFRFHVLPRSFSITVLQQTNGMFRVDFRHWWTIHAFRLRVIQQTERAGVDMLSRL
jgi:hypothetical protein